MSDALEAPARKRVATRVGPSSRTPETRSKTASLATAAAAAAPPPPPPPATVVRFRTAGGRYSYLSASATAPSEARPLPVSPPDSEAPWLLTRATDVQIDSRLAPLECRYSDLAITAATPLAGTGASAMVFRTAFRGRQVAAKVFKNASADKYFDNEVRIMAEVGGHPNLIELVGFCRSPRTIILEYSEYGSLFDLLHNERELTTRRGVTPSPASSPAPNSAPSYSSAAVAPQLPSISQIVIQYHRARLAIGIARGMAHLHRHRYAHLDLTSRNVLVSRSIEAKICDYGLSVGMSDEGTSEHRLGHAPSYWKAPELCHKPRQKRDCDTFTTKVDVFSYGMVLWEIFHAGQFPWNGDLHPDARLLAGDRPAIAADCPVDWRTLIIACWQHRPDLRPLSMDIIQWIDDNIDVLLGPDRGRS